MQVSPDGALYRLLCMEGAAVMPVRPTRPVVFIDSYGSRCLAPVDAREASRHGKGNG